MAIATTKARIVGPNDGKAGPLMGIGARLMVEGVDTGGGFSLVEHPMPPRTLGAPLHRHTHEDEYSYVLTGRMGALLGDEVVEAGPGDLVFKPRNQWHSFWNAGDDECRILELIAPGGFEQYFGEIVDHGGVAAMTPEQLGDLNRRYALDMRIESVPELCARFGLQA